MARPNAHEPQVTTLLQARYNTVFWHSDNGNAGKRGGAMPESIVPESIDWPQTHPPRRRRRMLLILPILAAIAFAGRAALSYFVNALWSSSLPSPYIFSQPLT